jgi:hypothetical protein
MLINSDDKMFGTSNNFSVMLQDGDGPLKNVIAVTPLRFEYYDSSGKNGGLLYLNDWNRIRTSSSSNTMSVFHRFLSNVETLTCPMSVSGCLDNPYTYILRPPALKLDRFDVRLTDTNYIPLNATNPKILIHLAVYCKDI